MSRHVSTDSAHFTNPTEPDLSTNYQNSNGSPVTTTENDNDSSPSRQNHDQTTETRRPRVSFSDFDKIQFYEGNNESTLKSRYRRHRHRTSKNSAAIIGSNYISPPSIQHTQPLNTPYRPLSRQQPIGHELSIKKQVLFPSPRIHSSRITHLPDILNQSLSIENSVHEKYVLPREKTSTRFPEPAAEIPINSSAEISRESTRAGGIRSSAVHDSNHKLETGDGGMNSLLNSNSLSSSLTSRQRPLRTISLRQQFNSPIVNTRISPIANNQQIITNPRRSASFKYPTSRLHSADDDQEEILNHESIPISDNRPTTGVSTSRQIRNNYLIHFNSKNSSNGHLTLNTNEKYRYLIKSNFHESSRERFHNILKIVPPPYMANINGTNNDSTLQTAMNSTNGSVRSSRTNSGNRGSHEFHIATNTIFV